MEVAVGNLARQILDRQPHCVDVLVAIADLLLELLDRLGARCQLVLEWRQLQFNVAISSSRACRPVAFSTSVISVSIGCGCAPPRPSARQAWS
jgi:hypothetical protein